MKNQASITYLKGVLLLLFNVKYVEKCKQIKIWALKMFSRLSYFEF